MVRSTPSSRAKSACDYCRIKKARCDASKPCSNCVKKGIVCSYNPEDVNPPSKMDRSFHQLEDKINRLDQKVSMLIDKLCPDNNSYCGSDELGLGSYNISSTSNSILDSPPLDSFFNDTDLLASVTDDLLSVLQSDYGQPSDNLNYMNQSFDINTKHPYMINFADVFEPSSSPNNKMDITSIVDTKSESTVNLSITKKTILQENEFSYKGKVSIRDVGISDLNLGNVFVDELLESYLEHIYPFYPIVCEATIATIKTDINAHGFITSVSTCEYFLLLALGEVTLAKEDGEYWRNSERLPPGFNYFWIAISQVDKVRKIEKNGFGTITIELLLAVYYLKIGQLNDHREELLKGCEMLFQFLELEGHKHRHRDILLRLYWVFLHLERLLYNMNLLENGSSLYDIQSKISIPRGCKTNFPKDADTFYSTCYMQSILLANVNDRALSLQYSDMTLNDCLRAFIKFEHELNNWRQLLPFSFKWEDDVTIRSTHIEMDLLKIKYYLVYVTVCQIVVKKYQNGHTEFSVDLQRLYSNQVSKLVEKSISFTEKASFIFSRQLITDLDPFMCYNLISAFKFIKSCSNTKITINELSLVKLNCFALHSPKLHDYLKLI